jgi:hypothetical protein
LAARRFSFREVLVQQQPVPLIGNKRGGFRYNRRDIQIDERFEAVSPSDARVLIMAKLAREAPPPEPAARARATNAAAGDDRSRTATHDAGIPTTPRAIAEKLDRELAPGAPPIPPGETVTLKGRGGLEFDAPPELGGPAPKKKRVRNRKAKAKAPDSAPNL